MRILITGGSGFVGRNLTTYLIDKYPDYSVVNFDRSEWSFGKRQYFYVAGDIRNQELVSRTIKEYQIDSLINLANDTSGPEIKQIESNVCGQFVLLNEAGENSLERFVYLSSDGVYVPSKEGLSSPVLEEDSVIAHDLPSACKIAAESLAMSAYHTRNLPIVILRSVDCLGSWLKPGHLISLLIASALQNNSLPIYHEGRKQQDWLHVSDLCIATDKALHLKTITGEIINLGWGVPHSVLDTAKLILASTDKPETLIKFIEEENNREVTGAPPLDSAKAEKLLGWKPAINFSDTLNNTVDWFKKNPDWWGEEHI
ncbi:NAD-dependent epimerase/dehydratase family protein [Patescibacteria group bacterium]|nr:NAD-dependent epimerase/dehydratase family protein [Patescibacteria group bacterium]